MIVRNVATVDSANVSVTHHGMYFNSYSGDVTIPDSVTYDGAKYCVANIEDQAFRSSTSLTSVTIGNGVTSIGERAFGSCESLTSIVVEEGNTHYDSRENSNAIIETNTNTLISGCKNTVIPSSVTSIGASAFCNCYDLTSVTIPSSVTSIGTRAFEGCNHLVSIICDIKVPLTIEANVFNNVDKSTCVLNVPAGCIDAYKAADVWKDFKNIREK